MTGIVKKRNVMTPNKNVCAVNYVTYWKKMLLRDFKNKTNGQTTHQQSTETMGFLTW